MGLNVAWYSRKARDEAVSEARKMNDELKQRVEKLERIVARLCSDKSDDV